MLRAIPWTVLALAPIAQARIGRLSPDEKLTECCPCPPPGQSSNGGSMITVTQPAQTVYVSVAQEPPTHTVTVERTVTMDAHTVYVTQPNDGPSVSLRPYSEFTQRSGPQTVTAIQGGGQGSAQGQYQPLPVTTTLQPESLKRLSNLGPMTVTAKTDAPVEPGSSVFVAQYQPSLEAPWSPPSVVAVTQQQQPAPTVVTVTASPESPAASTTTAIQPQGHPTVTVTIQPSIASVQPAAVTASAQVQTIFQTIDHYYTLTKTVGGGGGDNIEIVIINIFTGETFCKKKHSGKSCHATGHSGGHQYFSSAAAGTAAVTATGPSQMPRPSSNITTSVGSTNKTGIVLSSAAAGTAAVTATGPSQMPRPSANITTSVGSTNKTGIVLSSAAAGTAAVTATGPSQMPRPSANITTSDGSTNKTGIVALPSGNLTGAALPTGSGRPVPIMGRKPRSPLSPRKW